MRLTGDGVTDDTAAINRAMTDGGRCAPGVCASSTTTPAIVYFPAVSVLGPFIIPMLIFPPGYLCCLFFYRRLLQHLDHRQPQLSSHA